ncbi:MAG: DUF87 domain-containing protein [Candidatus Cloacimonetes bacterium]|nr:DUF87 domain-containing protein [Candidatus Cloacimonadota bacterium]
MDVHSQNQIQTKQMEMASESVNQYNIAYDIVNKTYLNKLNTLDIIPFQKSGFELRGSMNFRLLEITRIVHGDRKSTLENLMNILSTLHPDYGVVLIIKSDSKDTFFYIGIRSYNQAKPASSGITLLEKSLDGHFPGSSHRSLKDSEITSVLDTSKIREANLSWAIGAAPLVPDLKHGDYDQFTQGLERFIDAMYGKEYTALILAEPVNHENLVSLQSGYESMATSLSLYQKTQISMSINDSQAISEAISLGVTETLSQSISMSQGYTEGTSSSKSVSMGKTSNPAAIAGGIGAAAGAAIGSFIPIVGTIAGSIIGGAIGGAVGGLVSSKTETNSTSESVNESNTHSESQQRGRADSMSQTQTDSKSITSGKSETISLEQQNKGIERMLLKIDQQLKRLDASRSYGIWNASFFVLSDSTESAHIACSIFKGILKGKESAIEDSAIAVWNQRQEAKRDSAFEYINNLVIPRLKLNEHISLNKVLVTSSSLLSGKELSLLMNFPRNSVSGLTVIDAVSYGREPRILDISSIHQPVDTKDNLTLGVVRNLFKDYAQKVQISPPNLVYHTLVTGTTGVGKTNSVKVIISEIFKKGTPFLLIEPAKNEYQEMIMLSNDKHPISYYQAGNGNQNYSNNNCLKMNPLVFPFNTKITINEHIDRVCALFNAAFPMYAAMPQILEEAIIQAYTNCGWDLTTSCSITGTPIFPTLNDVAELIPTIVNNAGYEFETRSTYIGALTTRLKSLTRGSLGHTFIVGQDQETPPELLFDRYCIVNLNSIGSSDKKSLIMGLLLIRLYEHRMTQPTNNSDQLQHLMILEEAHHLLKKVSKDQNQEGSNPQGEAVEYLGNMLAEMRAYGQGMLIVDQSPSALDESVLRNTNIKIAFRAPFEDDRKIIGGSLNLDDKQTRALATIENHTALIKQNDWLEPVLCHIDKFLKPIQRQVSDESALRHKDRCVLTKLLLLLLGERFPKNTSVPDADLDRIDIDNWLSNHIHCDNSRELLKAYFANPVLDFELEQMIPYLFAIPDIRIAMEDAFKYNHSPTSIINSVQAQIKINTIIENPVLLQEIAHTLLVACRTERAEKVDDILLDVAHEEEV